MAQMFPDAGVRQVVFPSSAEESLYHALATQLDDTWRVFYSCTLSTRDSERGAQDGEIDFVLYHPTHGVIALEVKGGRVQWEARQSQFFSVNRHGERFAIKNPFQQALVWKSRFVRFCREQGLRVPVAHAVCLPSVDPSEIPRGAAVDPDLILGRPQLTAVAPFLYGLVRRAHPPKYLQFDDVGPALERLLVGASYTTRLFLRDYLDGHDIRVRDVESLAESLLAPMAAAGRLAIEGEAGTGKTMLAAALAKQARDAGERVLLLTTNRLLNRQLSTQLGPGVEIVTYADIAAAFGVNLLVPPSTYSGSAQDWVQYDGPDTFVARVKASERRFDLVICDEAQDVQPFWWDGFEALLDGPRKLLIFFDRSQGVFGAGGDAFTPEEVLPVPAPYFPLIHNYRTTREIARFARHFRSTTTTLPSHCARLGYVPQVITYRDAEDCRHQLNRLVEQLLRQEGLREEEITLLSARAPGAASSVLRGVETIAGTPLDNLGRGSRKRAHAGAAPGSLALSTVVGFKGLETPVGILLNVSEYAMPLSNPIMASLAYVAITRAKHMLYVFVQEDDAKRDVFERAATAAHEAGNLVLASSDSDHECSGTVAHYNPQRVGWLQVHEGRLPGSRIMFFPHDVAQAQLGELQVGQRLRFRPRVEGTLMIAGDLRHVAS